jgi:hypothetical protein
MYFREQRAAQRAVEKADKPKTARP